MKNKEIEINLNKLNNDRASFDSLGDIYPVDDTVEITREPIADVTCYWFVPPTFDEGKIIIHLHGGLFGLGSIHSHKPMVSHFASTLATKVLFVEYALAPEKPFPNALKDVLKVYRELIRKYPNAKISFIGDSAGGGLSVSLIKIATEEKLQAPFSVIFISPWLYLKCNTESYETRKRMDQVLTKDMLVEYANYYVDNNSWNEADPSQLNFSSFPPLFILVGSNEILFDDSRLFYQKIKPLQSNTKIKEYKNENHVWLLADIKSEGAKNALADIKEFITKTTTR
jgi:epsilon-lactone hydrolase